MDFIGQQQRRNQRVAFAVSLEPISHPSGEVDDVGRLVLLEDGLRGLHVSQVAVLAAKEHVFFVLLGLMMLYKHNVEEHAGSDDT